MNYDYNESIWYQERSHYNIMKQYHHMKDQESVPESLKSKKEYADTYYNNYQKFLEFMMPYKDNYVLVKPDKHKLVKLKNFIADFWNNPIKRGEMIECHRGDVNSFPLRFYNGIAAELALEKLFGIEGIFDWEIGTQKMFKKKDLSNIGLDIGIKTTTMPRYHLIKKDDIVTPEIMCVKVPPTEDKITDIYDVKILVCGYCTPENLKNSLDDDLIFGPTVKKQGRKSCWYGYDKLLPFGSLEQLKVIHKENMA